MEDEFIGVVQTTDAPVFAGTVVTGRSLTCAGCKTMTLIENYDDGAYFGFGIKCHACGTVTTLPSLADGEIFPNPILTLGDKGRYCIGCPVSVHPGVVVTTDQEIAKQQELTRPKQLPESRQP